MPSKKAGPRRASKQTATSKTSAGGTLKAVRALSARARDEVAELLAQEQTGDITRTQLRAALKELKARLKRLMDFTFRL